MIVKKLKLKSQNVEDRWIGKKEIFVEFLKQSLFTSNGPSSVRVSSFLKFGFKLIMMIPVTEKCRLENSTLHTINTK